MRHSDFTKLYAAYLTELANLDRFVYLDESKTYVAHIQVGIRGRLEPMPKAELCVYEKETVTEGNDLTVDWQTIELDELPGSLLRVVGDLKDKLERWNKNELDDLPTSNAPNVWLHAEEAFEKRRTFRRRRR